MIEDKTKEQQPASPVKPKRGQRLRSLWAQLQCMGLLHRHRLRRKTQNHVNDFGRKLAQNSAVPVIGETLYALGYSTEYGFVRVGRGLRSGCGAAAKSSDEIGRLGASLLLEGRINDPAYATDFAPDFL